MIYKHVVEDAKRCLQCHSPLCSTGCPVATSIREVISLFLASDIQEAGRILFENNPLSLVCSYVCHQENQCEGHCIQGRKGMPVHISAIERYISDFYLSTYQPRRSTKERGKVAVIGGGPSGITIAFILASRNFGVTLYEGNDSLGGMLRYGIPEFRLPKSIIDRLAEKLLDSGVYIRPNTTIGSNLSVDDLFRDGFDAVFLGTGVWKPRQLHVVGESLGNVHYAIEYLRNPDAYRLGNSVSVIGAGNVAMDVARTAVRHGSRQVTVYARSDASSITAYDSSLEYAKIDGVTIELFKAVVEITEQGAIFIDTEVVTDAEGKKKTVPIAGTESLEPSDSIILAIGQGPRSVIVSSTKGIDLKASGLVDVDEWGHTTRAGVFAGGDVVTGAKTVVEAVRISKQVADAIDAYVTALKQNNSSDA